MVKLRMSKHNEIETPVVKRQVAAECGSDRFAAGAAVQQDAMTFGTLDQDGFALADVQEGYGEASVVGR